MPSQTLLVPLVGLAGGVLLLLAGLAKRHKANRLAGYRRTATGHLRPGEKQLVSGPASRLADLTAPISKKTCVFYQEDVERLVVTHGRKSASSRWVKEGSSSVGGFRLDDGSGGVLVFPRAGCLDFSREPATEDGDLVASEGSIRRSEQALFDGDQVTVIGVPVTLAAVLEQARAGSQLNLPTDLLGALIKLEKEGGSATPCFFGSGLGTVADLPYDTYAAEAASSARLYLQAGGIAAALSAAALAYTLISSAPSSDF